MMPAGDIDWLTDSQERLCVGLCGSIAPVIFPSNTLETAVSKRFVELRSMDTANRQTTKPYGSFKAVFFMDVPCALRIVTLQ